MGSIEGIGLVERHEFIQALVKGNLGREVSSIAPLGRDSNNSVHLVSLVEVSPNSINGYVTTSQKTGTKSLPQSTQKIVFRVENDVAAITLMQEALSEFPSKITLDIYAWNTAAGGRGWIEEEYMRGDTLSAMFSELSRSQKATILDQVAKVFKMIQGYELPHTITGFGGLNFDREGNVITGGLAIWFGGPFDSYRTMVLSIFRKQMELSKTTPLPNGWKDTDLSKRLEKFESSGMTKLLEKYSRIQPTLIHGKFGFENILVGPETLEVTGLLDFDFTHIASPCDEYLYSFMDFHGLVPGPYEDTELEMLRLAQLSAFKDFEVPVPIGEAGVDWTVARMWQEAMKKFGVNTPSDIPGVGELAAIYWFLLDVCPPYFLLPRWQKRVTEEQQQASKKEI